MAGLEFRVFADSREKPFERSFQVFENLLLGMNRSQLEPGRFRIVSPGGQQRGHTLSVVEELASVFVILFLVRQRLVPNVAARTRKSAQQALLTPIGDQLETKGFLDLHELMMHQNSEGSIPDAAYGVSAILPRPEERGLTRIRINEGSRLGFEVQAGLQARRIEVQFDGFFAESWFVCFAHQFQSVRVFPD